MRGDPDEFRVSDGITWGLGATFPSRSQFRALLEWNGEFVIKDNTQVIDAPFVAEDGSVAPMLSRISDPTTFKFGGVWQAKSGFFVHAGGNYSPGTQGRVVNGTDIDHSAWGLDLRVGIHRGRDAAAAACAPHQGDDDRYEHDDGDCGDSGAASARPEPAADGQHPVRPERCVEPGQTSRCAAQATDPEGGPLTYRWTRAAGQLQPDRRGEHDVHGAADGRSRQRDRGRDRQREERGDGVGDAARPARAR